MICDSTSIKPLVVNLQASSECMQQALVLHVVYEQYNTVLVETCIYTTATVGAHRHQTLVIRQVIGI